MTANDKIILQANEESSLRQQYLDLNGTLESLRSHSASLEGDVVNKDKKLTQLEAIVETFKSERDQLLQQVSDEATKTIPSTGPQDNVSHNGLLNLQNKNNLNTKNLKKNNLSDCRKWLSIVIEK